MKELDIRRENKRIFAAILFYFVCICYSLSNQINYQINVKTNQHGFSSGNDASAILRT